MTPHLPEGAADALTSLQAPPISVEGLTVSLPAERRTIVADVSFTVQRGETLGIVGESGAGKTAVALALLGHARPGMSITAGRISVLGRSILELESNELRSLRGRTIAYVPQDAGTALSPSMRIERQLHEILPAHGRVSTQLAAAKVAAACASAQLPTDNAELDRLPYQLSGGQRQRAALAMALLWRPPVMVIDEPTTGLDVTIQARLLATIDELTSSRQLAVVYVSHDLAVVRSLADRVLVMRDGRVIESGPAEQVFTRPAHPYTRALLRAIPRLPTPARAGQVPAQGDSAGVGGQRATTETTPEVVLEVESLRAAYARPGAPAVEVLHGISFMVNRGSCIGVVGESGSGKTTLLRCLAGLHSHAEGKIALGGRRLNVNGRGRSRDSRRRIQLVPQDPDTSLNPHHSVAQIVGRPLRQFEGLRGSRQQDRVLELLDAVSLDRSFAGRFPRQLSGGQRQRVAVARALAAQPDVMLCDEVTSCLDVLVQAELLALLDDLRVTYGMTVVFVSHDLAVVNRVSDQVLVVRDGVICEAGPTARVLRTPGDSYTQALLAAVPTLMEGDVSG